MRRERLAGFLTLQVSVLRVAIVVSWCLTVVSCELKTHFNHYSGCNFLQPLQ